MSNKKNANQIVKTASKAKCSKNSYLYSDKGGSDDDLMGTIPPIPPKNKKTRSSTAPATQVSFTRATQRPIDHTIHQANAQNVPVILNVVPTLVPMAPVVPYADVIASMQVQIEMLTQRTLQNNQVIPTDSSRFVAVGIDGTSKHIIDELFG